MVLSRSTYPGSGKYAVHWLGDNSADWTQMSMSVVGEVVRVTLMIPKCKGGAVAAFLSLIFLLQLADL